MAFLLNERARLQAEVQAAGAQITSLTTQLQTQQQAVVAAQGRVSAAQARIADAQSKIPGLEAAAASADQRTESANQAVENHSANEPDQLIGRPPRPNPAWRTWKTQLDRLTEQLSAAQAEAGAAHGRLNDGRNEVSLAVAERQAAERQVTDANNAVAATQQALVAARQRRKQPPWIGGTTRSPATPWSGQRWSRPPPSCPAARPLSMKRLRSRVSNVKSPRKLRRR